MNVYLIGFQPQTDKNKGIWYNILFLNSTRPKSSVSFDFSLKYADVTPLPKEKPVTIITKHIRPTCISLTPVIFKVAEELIVQNHVGPAVLDIIDPNQFGAIPKSSTTHSNSNFNGARLDESHRRKPFCSEDCTFELQEGV